MSLQMCIDSLPLTRGLSSLYADQQLTDIRIVCSDGYLMAHKVVLATASHKLREMISTDSTMASNTMVLILSDVCLEDIKAIVDCIYFGQKCIQSNRFKQLSQIADNLGIKVSSAVSAAFAATYILPSVLTTTSHPKTTQRKSLILSDTKKSTQKPLESIQMSFEDSDVETPMDLSVIHKDTIEENVRKIIDSIATNGPKRTQTPGVRRRKQTDPKTILSKVVRFDEIAETSSAQNDNEFDSVADDFIGEYMTNFNEFAHNLSVIPQTTLDSGIPSQCDDQTVDKREIINEDTNEDIKSEVKIVDNSTTKAKTVGRIAKTVSVSDEQLKDCCVCGKTHSTHKQLILHLNKEHKTNDCFKCAVCGKEQKYAKSFAQHCVQCQTTKV